jgi:hypothetical protein
MRAALAETASIGAEPASTRFSRFWSRIQVRFVVGLGFRYEF